MKYALITLAESTLFKWQLDVNENQVYLETAAPAGSIANIIDWDEVSDYAPPEGCSCVEVPDEAQIGDSGY